MGSLVILKTKVVGRVKDMCTSGQRVRRPTRRTRLLPMNSGQLRRVLGVVSVVNIISRRRNYSHQRKHNRTRRVELIPYIHRDSIILVTTTIEKR